MVVWREVELGDVLDVLHGFAFKGEYFGTGGPNRVVTPGNFIETGGFVDRGQLQKSYDGVVPSEFVLAPGALIVAMTEQSPGLLGSSGLIPDDGQTWLHNQRIGLIKLNEPVQADLRFVYYLLNASTVRAQISATATGVKVRHTAPVRIRAVRAQLPGLGPQKRIARVLSAFDELIELNERRIEILEDLARSLYREWFVRFRFPGHEEVKLVDSELGSIPNGWEVRSLGAITENRDRLRRPVSSAERTGRPGPFPYYGAAKLIDWIDGWIFDGEHLLFAEDGTVQTPEGWPVLQLVDGKFWANNHTHILRGAGVSTRFLYFAVSRYPIGGHITGAAQPKITQANLNRVTVLVPTPAILDQFGALIDPVLDGAQAARARISLLASTRDLLLPRLVTGRLDISDVDLGDLLPAATT